MLKGRLDPTGKILLDFEKWEENVISAADDGFYGQASEPVVAKAMVKRGQGHWQSLRRPLSITAKVMAKS